MDFETLNFYQNNSESLSQFYNSCKGGIRKYFPISFLPNSRILDTGAGSGRDLVALLEMGFDAYGIEPCDNFIKLAINKNPELKDRLIIGHLPDEVEPFGGKFDGIVCSAVLMHIPEQYLFDSVYYLKKLLIENGRLLISIPINRHGLKQNLMDINNRLYNNLSPEQLSLILERVGFSLIGSWTDEDGLGREKHQWATLLFQLRNSQVNRPIDQVESIINRDKKFATYKLALFRALCEIAMMHFGCVKWLPDKKVAIDIELVAEKWIFYYWPLFESELTIPQLRNIDKLCRFAPALHDLIGIYKNIGGLSAFVVDYRNKDFSSKREIMKKTFRAVIETIKVGPVIYSGGSLETGTIFAYDKKEKKIILGAEIWKEICLMGHWINDAIILRWAELTSEFSKRMIKPSEVINLLLTLPTSERDVKEAKDAYLKIGNKECVWSGKSINKSFAVDHLLPFSFWHNNDLWNLLPTEQSVNNSKSDKIPSRNLLIKRKEIIIYYWQYLFNSYRNRFQFEASKCVEYVNQGDNNWENKLFAYIIEAAEVTALQRGCERWEP